jgi:hypothetical protein
MLLMDDLVMDLCIVTLSRWYTKFSHKSWGPKDAENLWCNAYTVCFYDVTGICFPATLKTLTIWSLVFIFLPHMLACLITWYWEIKIKKGKQFSVILHYSGYNRSFHWLNWK